MSVIRYVPKFEPIKCQFCGCEYAFEKQDNISVVVPSGGYSVADGKYYQDGNTLLMLKCPICGSNNPLEREEEKNA